MIFVYNFLQTALLITFFPLVILIVLSNEKYRSRIAERLGLGLKQKIASLNPQQKKVLWVHSLSVGEVTSSLPLVKGIKEEMDVCIVFSASTRTGINIAQEKIKPHVDLVLSAPLDLWPVVKRFTELLKPDMFILVETDFWPNWLHCLRQRKIPLVLVNGRISKLSFARYLRYQFFFQRLFQSFSLLSMQTETDALQMAKLGIPGDRIKTLGNLKYDMYLNDKNPSVSSGIPALRIPVNSMVWVCGSTHPGEEKILITAFASIRNKRKDCFLILAPRDPARGDEIQQLIAEQDMQSMRRTCPTDDDAPILILDTIGELADCYPLARVAFIGGSLVDSGGHNPLEASACGVPVLFGPHMDDFLEIAHDLLDCGAAVTVDSAVQLEKNINQILDDNTIHQQMGKAAYDLVMRNSGVVKHHIQELSTLLSTSLKN